ncbi:MAG: preprotein translocase subunit YajC [Treponema sp.]|jgi:preprotein translocase subunit YajC|nr:preprotein translocase subunit YajC [Treponema sp.]
MNQLIFFPLMGAPGGAPASTSQSLLSLLPIVAIFAIFYFLMIRPQNKKQKETQRMLEALKKGDRVVTIGGIHGVIQSVREKTVIVKVDENCKIEFTRAAIASVEASAKEKDSGKAGEETSAGDGAE